MRRRVLRVAFPAIPLRRQNQSGSSPNQPPMQSLHRRMHAYILKRFKSWCKANNASYLPARHQDVVAFLTELAKTYPQSYLKLALTAIARIHTDAGYTPPSHEPEVTSALKHLKGTPRQLVTDSQPRRKPRPTNSAMDRLVPTTQIRTGRRNRRTISPVLTATGHWALRRLPEEVPIRDRPPCTQTARSLTTRKHKHSSTPPPQAPNEKPSAMPPGR